MDGRLSAPDLQVEIGPPTPLNHFWGHKLRDGSMREELVSALVPRAHGLDREPPAGQPKSFFCLALATRSPFIIKDGDSTGTW